MRRTLKWTLRYQPDHDVVLLLWGMSLYVDGKFEDSIEFLERVSPKSKRGSEAERALASALMHDLQVDRAEQVFLRHLERQPQSILASQELRLLYLKELRLRDATIFLENRWAKFPGNLSILPALLHLETAVANPREWIGWLREVDQKHPNQVVVVLALARAHSMMGETEPARQRFLAAIELQPNDPEIRLAAASFFLQVGEDSKVRQLLPRANQLKNSSEFAVDDRYWSLRSRLEQLAGEPENALFSIQRATYFRTLLVGYFEGNRSHPFMRRC